MAKIRILFDAFHLYHLPQFDPVIDLLTSDKRFEVRITTSPLIKEEEIRLTLEIFSSRNFNVLFDYDVSIHREMIRNFDPHVYICGWSRHKIEELVPEKTLVGMIYHGIGVKPSYWLDNHPRLDIRFAEGEARQNQLVEKGVETQTALTGFSKLDPIFNGQVKTRDETLQELGLDPLKKTILYAPTFYPSSFGVFGKKLIKYTEGYNLIIKLHMWVYFIDKFGGVSMKSQKRLIEKLKAGNNNIAIIDPQQYNIIPYYEAADVLLTEASSTIYEMLAIGKPVIVASFYKLYLSHRLFRSRLYRRRLDATMTKDIARFCRLIEKPSKLKQALHDVLSEDYRQSEDLKTWIRKWLYIPDGMASERIRDAILNWIEIKKKSVA